MQDTQFKNQLIDIIDEKIAESGGGLPEVTAADNGRVLGVDDGEWKAVEPNVPIIWATMNEDFELSYNYNQLLSLTDSGAIVFFKFIDTQVLEERTIIYRLGALLYSSAEGDEYRAVFYSGIGNEIIEMIFLATSATSPLILD